jgi:hypothetical protein
MAIRYQHTQVGRWMLAVAVPAMLLAASLAFASLLQAV